MSHLRACCGELRAESKSSALCPLLSALLSTLALFVDGNQLRSIFQLQFAHADEVLVDLGKSLLRFVNEIIGPIFEIFVDHSQSLCVVGRELDLLPHVGG